MKNLGRYFFECKRVLDILGIVYDKDVDVEVDTRALRRWGRCTITSYGSVISISSRLLQDEVSDVGLKTTLFHELLHTCYGCQNHGEGWKRLANVVSEYTGLHINRLASCLDYGISSEAVPLGNYKICCTDCGNTYYRIRKSKLVEHPEHYRCGVCGGHLKCSEE